MISRHGSSAAHRQSASASLGLVAAAVFGLRGTDVSRHISFGIFSTLVMLLAHSMMMFYLIGKGKAVKDAMAEHNVTGDYYRRIAAARKPVFSIGTLAMAVTMVAAILGASVDTGVLPADRARDDRVRRDRLQSRRRQDRGRRTHRLHPHRRRSEPPDRLVTDRRSSSSPDVSKDYRGLRPLRIAAARPSRRASTSRSSASISRRPKSFVNLVTGATLPDRGRGAAVRPPDGGDHRQRRLAADRRSLRHRQRPRGAARRADGRCRTSRCRSRSRSSRRPTTSASAPSRWRGEVGLDADVAGDGRWRSSMPAGAHARPAWRGRSRSIPAVLLLEHPTADCRAKRSRRSATHVPARSLAAAERSLP